MSDAGGVTEKIQHHDPVLVACVVFQTQAPEHLIQKIREAVTAIAAQTPASPIIAEINSLRSVPEDAWLRHSEAAKYLGISKSTLYRYVCQRRIECRKIAGRLEYRRSSLEKLKKDQIRPARLSYRAGGIIHSAFSSGK